MRDGKNHLLTEGLVGDLAIIFRNRHKAAVGSESEPLENMLPQLEQEGGIKLGHQEGARAVCRYPRIIKGDVEQSAGRKSLLIAEIRASGVLKKRGNAADYGIRLRNVTVLYPQAGAESWIERVDRRTNAECRRNQSTSSGSCSTRCSHRAPGATASSAASDPTDTRAWSALYDSRIHAANVGA